MDILITILIVFLVTVILVCLWLINPFYYLMKFLAPFRRNIVFWNGFRRYRINVPETRLSWYFNRFPVKSYETAGFNATIDDLVMCSIADQLRPLLEGKSDRTKANIILRCVQQSVRYMSDQKRFGSAERWMFPIGCLYYRTGDCEDTSFMFACLAHLCGLDSILVLMPGHMACAVNIGRKGLKTYTVNGKHYVHAETTGVNPVGIYLGDKNATRFFHILAPTDTWKARGTVEDRFDKYD